MWLHWIIRITLTPAFLQLICHEGRLTLTAVCTSIQAACKNRLWLVVRLQRSRGNHSSWNSEGPLIVQTISTKIAVGGCPNQLLKNNKVRTYLLRGQWWVDRLLLARPKPATPCTKVNTEGPFCKTISIVRKVCWPKNLRLLMRKFSIKDKEVRTNWAMSKRSANMASEKCCQENA